VGRIEAGRAWPDLATVARLAKALNLTLTIASPGPPARGADTPASPTSPEPPASAVGVPLEVDLTGLAEPTAAHVIEAILHNSPRLRSQVEGLRQARHRPR
jgi:hypothetical protein